MDQYGALAEWLRRGLQNLVHRFNPGRRLQNVLVSLGRVAELVYAADLKSAGLNYLEGSSPSLPTINVLLSQNAL